MPGLLVQEPNRHEHTNTQTHRDSLSISFSPSLPLSLSLYHFYIHTTSASLLTSPPLVASKQILKTDAHDSLHTYTHAFTKCCENNCRNHMQRIHGLSPPVAVPASLCAAPPSRTRPEPAQPPESPTCFACAELHLSQVTVLTIIIADVLAHGAHIGHKPLQYVLIKPVDSSNSKTEYVLEVHGAIRDDTLRPH
jgi:hypothetical protein